MALRQITFDAASSGATSASLGASSLTISHTVGTADTERCLFVWVSIQGTGSTISGVTYAGVSMTQASVYSAGNVRVGLFYLTNPSAGAAYNIEITLSGNAHFTGGGVSYYGVSQSSPLDTAQTYGGTSHDATGQGPTYENDLTLGLFVKNDTTEAPTIASGTQRALTNSTGGAGAVNCYGGIAESAGAGGDWVTINWTWTLANRDWAFIAAAVHPATYLGAQGSITVETTGSANTGSVGATTLVINLTLGSGTNRMLALGVSCFTDSTFTVNFPKYNNATTMTQGVSDHVVGGAESEIYYYAIPDGDTGAKTVNMQWASSGRRSASAIVLAGCNTASVGNTASATGSSTTGTSTISVTTNAGEVVVDSLAKRDSTEGANPDTGQTGQTSDVTTNATPGNNIWTKASTKDANQGNTTMGWPWTAPSTTGARQYALCALAFKPATFIPKFLPEQLGLSPLSGVH